MKKKRQIKTIELSLICFPYLQYCICQIKNTMFKQYVDVGIRIRPLAPEQEHMQRECVNIDNNRILVSNNHKVKSFEYKKVYDKYSDQQYIFQHFGLPLVQEMFKGFNSCLIVYGQNKSGKTYTICGKQSQESKGIIPRIVDHINCKIYAENTTNNKILYIFRVSYIDIFQEQIIDLLTIRKGIQIKIVNDKEGQIRIKNIEIKSISKLQDIQSYFLIGNRKRQYAFAKKYRNSERTTSIFTIYYESLNRSSGQKILIGKYDIVDFHASQVINRFQPIEQIKMKNPLYDLSVNSFKNIVQGIVYGNKDSIIPYNDSKITKLLRQSIGGNSKTKILFHINPIAKNYSAIIQSLRLASICSLIQNIPSLNINQENSISKEYLLLIKQQQEIEEQLYFYEEKNYKSWLLRMKNQQQQENQFITEQFLQEKYYQEYGELIQENKKVREGLKNKISNLFNLFLHFQQLNKHQIAFFKENYQNVITKSHQREKQMAKIMGNSFQGQINRDSYGENLGSKKNTEKQRVYKQEINDLHLQYQEEKEFLINTLRQMQMKYKFYEKVAKNVVKKEEIDLIKMNSKYDTTKRAFQLPLFAIRDKKITHSSNYFSPNQRNLMNSRSNSQRKFLMSKLSQSKIQKIDRLNSPPLSNRQNSQKSSMKPRQQQQNEDYFFKQKIEKKEKKQQSKRQQIFKMSKDQYQMVKSSFTSNRHKLKQQKPSEAQINKSLSSSNKIKLIKPLLSTRFKFK